jgi:predicted nuclease of predicted toxin-antitoxin system
MKFLFDENISYRIIKKINGYNQEHLHVSRSGLTMPSEDSDIWQFAKVNNFLSVTFDEDFENMSNLFGFPPKVVLLHLGNSSTQSIAEALLGQMSDIKRFYNSDTHGILEIF